MRIDVTQEDIDNAGRGCGNCPIALAVARATGKPHVWVDYFGIAWDRPEEYWTWGEVKYNVTPTPPDARNFMAVFDDGKPVQPFSFEL